MQLVFPILICWIVIYPVDSTSELQIPRQEWLQEQDFLNLLSIASAWTSIILARKGDNHCHATTGLRKNVLVSYVRGFIILQLVEGLTSFNKDNSANFAGE